MLTTETVRRVQQESHDLLRASMPGLADALQPVDIDVADFSLTNPGYNVGDRIDIRLREGLDKRTIERVGLEIVLLANRGGSVLLPPTRTHGGVSSTGYCGKVLMWLPAAEGAEFGQFLPTHAHYPIIALPRAELRSRHVPKGMDGLVALQDVNPDFGEGDAKQNFPLTDFQYNVPLKEVRGGYVPVGAAALGQVKRFTEKYGGAVIPGKGETFTVIHGEGWYIGPSLGIKDENKLFSRGKTHPIFSAVPAEERELISRLEDKSSWVVVEMVPGGSYAIPPGHNHAVIAKTGGLVAIESSGESYDPGDVFSNPRIRRMTKVFDETRGVVRPLSDYLEEQTGRPRLRG